MGMDIMILYKWFHENHVTKSWKTTLYCDRWYDLSHIRLLINKKISSSNEEQLLGIPLDSKLSFILILHPLV